MSETKTKTPEREQQPLDADAGHGSVPALREPSTTDVELRRIARLGSWLAAVEGHALNDAMAGASAAYRIWIAEALDLGPAAASDLHVIDKRVSISAALLRALAERDGYRVSCEHVDDESCTAAIWRDGRELGRASFTMDDAKRAGLASKKNWQSYPQRMLWARASTFAVRDFAPGVALGLRTTEEMGADVVDEPAPTHPGAYDEPFVEDAEFEAVTPDELGELANEPADER
jgi:hypothetical protein